MFHSVVLESMPAPTCANPRVPVMTRERRFVKDPNPTEGFTAISVKRSPFVQPNVHRGPHLTLTLPPFVHCRWKSINY